MVPGKKGAERAKIEAEVKKAEMTLVARQEEEQRMLEEAGGILKREPSSQDLAEGLARTYCGTEDCMAPEVLRHDGTVYSYAVDWCQALPCALCCTQCACGCLC